MVVLVANVTKATIKWLENTQRSMLVRSAKNVSSYVTSELCICKEDATDCFI